MLNERIYYKVRESMYRAGHALGFVGVWGFQTSRQSVHAVGKVVTTTQRPTLRLRIYPNQKLSGPQGHSAAETIMSIKMSNNTIRNRNRDLHSCSAVPQQTETSRVPNTNNLEHVCMSQTLLWHALLSSPGIIIIIIIIISWHMFTFFRTNFGKFARISTCYGF